MKHLKSSFYVALPGILLVLFMTGFLSCKPNEKKIFYATEKEEIKELGNGYYYRLDIRDILNHDSTKPDIPSDVMSYDFDSNFIIAKQIPKSMYDGGYTSQPEYTFGPDTSYYWMIIHNKDTAIGPLMEAEFTKAKTKYKVPAELGFEP